MTLQVDNTEVALEKVGVIQLEFSSDAKCEGGALRTSEEKLEEAVNLAQALDFDVVNSDIVTIRKANARTIIGKGKLQEIKAVVDSNDLDVIFINYQLSPAHQKNLETDLDVKVIDRTGLILEIFSQRARTKSGKLQVELARTLYEQTRLVRTWTHLERQRGGLGKTGGPGERQIELDRRILRDKISKLKRQLKDVEKTRAQHSKQRKRQDIKVISLVGYTNSGKSTLFNALTHAGTLSKDMLFATLDPLMRQVKLPSGDEVILSDTVGFISDLPHELVESFKSTLQEVLDSDLLLHVQDVSSQHYLAEKKDVEEVLQSIKAEDIKLLNVFNKIDLVPQEQRIFSTGVQTSAINQEGLDQLLEKIEEKLELNYQEYQIKVLQSDSKALGYLYKHAKEIDMEELESDKYLMKLKLKKKDYHSFVKNFS